MAMSQVLTTAIVELHASAQHDVSGHWILQLLQLGFVLAPFDVLLDAMISVRSEAFLMPSLIQFRCCSLFMI